MDCELLLLYRAAAAPVALGLHHLFQDLDLKGIENRFFCCCGVCLFLLQGLWNLFCCYFSFPIFSVRRTLYFFCSLCRSNQISLSVSQCGFVALL